MDRGSAYAVGAAALLVALGLPFIPLLGVQYDEALFAPLIWPESCGPAYGASMLMSYVGALKGWLYKALFAAWAPSVWSLRLPMLLAGAGAVALMARSLGPHGPLVALLVATDPVFLLTAVFDWGPVALHHLLLWTAVWLFTRGRESAAYAVLGALVWNKAVALWPLAGLFLAFRPRLSRVAWMAVGAAPLVWFNLASGFATLRDRPPAAGAGLAAAILWDSLDGSALMGYLVAGGDAAVALHPVEARLFAVPYRTLLPWFALAAVLVARIALAWRVFAAAVVAWLLMAATGGGGGAHHAVLLWPAPQILVACAATRAPAAVRWIGVALLVASQLGMTAQYYVRARYAGGAKGWSEAILSVADRLGELPPADVAVTDWGLRNNLCLLEPKHQYRDAPAAIVIAPLGDNAFAPGPSPPGEREIIRDRRGAPAYEIVRPIPSR